MIISRTPFRISFFGGGTDYPIWYRKHGGAVLATTINKYCYISCRYLPPFFPHKYRIIYSQIELVKNISEINHPSVREGLKFMKIKRGLEVHHDADLPARTGLGSSSSFTVGLLHTLNAIKGSISTKRQLALDAIYLEQEMMKENVGSQDQVSASFGGMNYIKFNSHQDIEVHPITITAKRMSLFHSHLMLFFTGFSRIASDIAAEQIKTIHSKTKELRQIHDMVDASLQILTGKSDFIKFGKLLHEHWKIKRGLSKKISTPLIDEMYTTALRAGAIGGKILGAGGGGFLLIFAKPQDQARIKEKLKKLLYVPFRFEDFGSQIIFYSPGTLW
ncbi:MAG: kinase [Candidatus Omnitrophota bacterium]